MDKKALYKLSYGVFIVGSKKGDALNAQTANVAFQVTAEPPKVAIALNKENLTHQFVSQSGVFSVSILGQDASLELIGRFGFRSGRDFNKLEGVNYKIGKTGAPIVLDGAVAWLDCRVTESLDMGTHTLFVGEVVDAEVLKPDAEPMTYAYYHAVKRGKEPPRAPTYRGEEEKAPEPKEGSKKWRCTVCGYVYDPAENGGVPFEELPEDWTCPVCGVGKDMFEPVEE